MISTTVLTRVRPAFPKCAATTLVVLFSLGAATFASSANAANVPTQSTSDNQDDVIVIARKQPELLQRIPGAVTSVSRSEMQSADLNDVFHLIELAPNVSMSGGIAGQLQGQIGVRGITTLVRNIGVESSVGFFVDGVALDRPEDYNQEWIDVDHVEIQRGPQNTLWGQNAIAGAFNIVTLKPSDRPEGEIELQVGDYDLLRTRGYLMGPLIAGKVAGKIAAGYVSRDGYYKNLSGGPNGDALNQFSARTQLYFTPTPRLDITASLDGLRDRGRPAFFQSSELIGVPSPIGAKPFRIDGNRPNFLNRDLWGASIQARHSFDHRVLTSITAYRSSQYLASLDDDQAQVDFLSADVWGDKTRTFSQEIRLNGQIGDRFRYIFGADYVDQRISTDRTLALGADLGFPAHPALRTIGSVETSKYALFGGGDFDLNARVTASFSLRLGRETKSAQFVQDDVEGVFGPLGLPTLRFAGAASHDAVLPTVSLSYQATKSIFAYVRAARGFKGAAFNVDVVPSTSGLAAGPETAWTSELGVKANLFARSLQANVAAFHTAYDNLQVSQLLGGGVALNSAARAAIDGLEFELSGHIAPPLSFGLSIGFLDARYDRYSNCPVPLSLSGGFTNCSGNRLVGAPKTTLNANIEYVRWSPIGEVVGRLDFIAQSRVFYEATNSSRFQSDDRSVVNASVRLRTARWNASIWVKNLTDVAYITYRDDRTAVGVPQTTAYGEPRMLGITLRRSF